MRTLKIRDLGRVVTGSTPPTANPAFYGSRYLFIKPSDLSPGQRRVFSTETTLSQEGGQHLGSKLLPPNSTCVVCIGTIGKLGLTSEPCFTNQQLNSVVVDTSRHDPLYVFYLLSTIIPQLQQIQGGSASGREHVNKTNFENIEVTVHRLEDQKQIGSILSTYDDLIENNTRRITILEDIAQMLYREWFVKFRFPGHEKVRMVESELGPIPEGWAPTRLGDLCSEKRRGVHPNEIEPYTPYIGLEHLPRKSIALGVWGKAGDVGSTKLRFSRGDILFGKIRPYFHKVGVAPLDGVASSDAIVIVPSEVAYFAPVLCCCSSEAFVSHATQTSQGTKMPRANWDVLTKYPLPLPDPTLLGRFNGAIQPTVEMLQNLVFRNRNLRTTRDFLLPKLISGEIPVEAADDAAAELVAKPA